MTATTTRPLITRLLPRQLVPPQDPKVGLLSRLGLFAGVPHRALVSIAPLVDHLDLPAGARLITEGAPAAEAFVLVDETAQATLRGRAIGVAHAGELLGDLALLSATRAPVSWTAVSDVAVLVIGPRELREVLYRCPLVADRLRRHPAQPLTRLRAAVPPDAARAPGRDRGGAAGVRLRARSGYAAGPVTQTRAVAGPASAIAAGSRSAR
jgi:CRP-like cAMP-binding protein